MNSQLAHQLENPTSREDVLKTALEAILEKGANSCQSYTTGLGSCFRNGRSLDAKWGADKVCDCCIAAAALQKAQSIG
jgi:hypothetical protein